MAPQTKAADKKSGPGSRNNMILLGAIVLILVVIAAFFLLPKGGTQKPTPSAGVEVNVQDLLTDIVEATDRVENFKYDLTAELQAAGNTSQTVTISGSGDVDLNNRKMHTSLYITTPNGLQSTEVYMIQDTTYVKIGSQWVKRTSEGAWDFEETNIDRLRDLLTTAQGTLVGAENINGAETRVIKITPNIEQLVRYAINIQGATLTQEQVTEIADLFKQYVKSVEIKLWVNPENLIMRAKLDADIDMTGYSLVNARITVDATLNFENYNKGSVIELPGEAANATDLSTITP